jgi:hypothetical protein
VTPTSRACKDCGSTTRKLKPPGPRCASCAKLERERASKRKHELSVIRKYGLAPGEYDALYSYQQGRCYICRRAKGKTKRLAVDHDHKTGKVRGLLCGPCNREVIGWARDDVSFFHRCVEYHESPPYERMKRGDVVDA